MQTRKLGNSGLEVPATGARSGLDPDAVHAATFPIKVVDQVPPEAKRRPDDGQLA